MRPTVLSLCAALAILVGARPGLAQEMVCGAPPFDHPPEVAAVLDDLAPVLKAFPSFDRTLDNDLDALCLADRLYGVQGYMDPSDGRIVIARGLPEGLRAAVVVHELRHLQQLTLGACPAPGLAMAEHARAVLAMEADASVASLVVAWRMRELGREDLWEALAGWPMQADIAVAFEAEMHASGNVALAAGAAFQQWFESDSREEAYYVAACSQYLDEAERDHRLPSYGSLDPAFDARLCRLPDGTGYACTVP
ncbi:DUF6782 family putative metallopeptidase [Salipiger mucosus]|uniref:DUF6782 domain-containing protein n=1 Tax=Salipiger mucosus DSM 16094 TaxID=1123237 RepID=S9QZD4_9RHOB|nr:DUF6782 family putative metallopeptidase [Salipiger mucosus]EPX85033.1 hypothetical protein Salmuc_00631 [Salipiger mucosus DSM 16094]